MNNTLIDAPLLLAKFDQQLRCIAISRPWSEQVGRRSPPLALGELFKTENNEKLTVLLQGVWKNNTQIDALPATIAGDKNATPHLLNAWKELDAGQAVIMILLHQQPCESLNEELQRLRSEHALILSAVGEGIYGIDKEGRATFANAASTRILGWCSEAIIGTCLHDNHHHSQADGTPYSKENCRIYAALQDGEVHHVEDEVFWRDDGSCIPVEYTSTPIIKNNIIQGAVIIFRDISERKDHERSQKQAYKKIKQLKEELELERDYLRNEINITTNFGEIIGQSPALQRTLAQIEAVADTPSNVLILGESGVGKEMIARAIHNKSRRSDAPLVKVNCASIPKELFESEFFGHIRGSFTGAHRDRIGRLQLANGGTLFLDEIGEIPLALQSKLLRAIQEQEFERVGDEITSKVDVRIVAATNRDLATEVKAGRFREDLFYRLSVFPISVPPLRERIEDIAPLAQHFLYLSCQELRRDPMGISNTQIDLLNQHHWPGNIRELKNVIERAVILSKSSRLRLDLAMPELQDTNNKELHQTQADNDEFYTDEQFRQLEKNNLLKALRHTGWKISGKDGTAELMGLKPSTLAYRMQRFSIKKEHDTG